MVGRSGPATLAAIDGEEPVRYYKNEPFEFEYWLEWYNGDEARALEEWHAAPTSPKEESPPVVQVAKKRTSKRQTDKKNEASSSSAATE